MNNRNGHKIEHNGYASPLPYPEPKVVGPNLEYAQILQDDYAGLISEYTAISQYIYHGFVSKPQYSEIEEMYIKIAIVEMEHMELLAQTIVLLGGDPIYKAPSLKCNYWSGDLVYYGENLCDRLKADLISEYKAIDTYRKHIEMIDDPNIKALLERIIKDEEVHVKIFNKKINQYCKFDPYCK